MYRVFSNLCLYFFVETTKKLRHLLSKNYPREFIKCPRQFNSFLRKSADKKKVLFFFMTRQHKLIFKFNLNYIKIVNNNNSDCKAKKSWIPLLLHSNFGVQKETQNFKSENQLANRLWIGET